MADLAHTFPPPAVIETASDALIEAKAIGQRIRSLRHKRSMGLVELGQKSGLSPSYLSQIETGHVVPTLRNLARISLVFGKDLHYFFREKDRDFFRISRAKDRIQLLRKEKNVPFFLTESLSALMPDADIIPEVTDFLPGAKGKVLEPNHFQGVEFVFVVHGCLAAFIHEEGHILEASDVIWVDGNADRWYQCHGGETTKALLLACPQVP